MTPLDSKPKWAGHDQALALEFFSIIEFAYDEQERFDAELFARKLARHEGVKW